MKPIIYTLLLLLTAMAARAFSQEACRVYMPGIDQYYEGECRRGLAHGEGNASGDDTYTGQFRRGWPHGEGTYTWKNGDVYEGNWKRGKRHGQGTMTMQEDGEQLILEGKWRNDVFYASKTTPAYAIGHRIHVERYRIKRIGDGNSVVVSVHEHGRQHAAPIDFRFHLDTGSSIQIGQATGYDGVTFPADVKISYTIPDKLGQGAFLRVRFEVKINEPGEWEIILRH